MELDNFSPLSCRLALRHPQLRVLIELLLDFLKRKVKKMTAFSLLCIHVEVTHFGFIQYVPGDAGMNRLSYDFNRSSAIFVSLSKYS